MAKIFDARCPDCQREEELLEHRGEFCPERCPCGTAYTAEMRIFGAYAHAPVGVFLTKPLEVSQIGRTFTSNSEWREYQKQNPDARVVSPGDRYWRDFRDRAREKAETHARRAGFRDLDERREYIRNKQK